MHYYQHHIGDFTRDTANLDDHQLATYLRMMWAYYADEKPFEDDCDGIAFAVRSDEKTVARLLKHYFELGPDGWRHGRCDREISDYRAKGEKARASANARWKNAKAMRTHNERNANEPVFDANQEPRTKRKAKPPVVPLEGDGKMAPKVNKRGVNLEAWLASLEPGQKAIPPDAAVFRYAENAGIPRQFIAIAWFAFKGYMLARPDKRQVSWPLAFRNYVAENYLKLWAPEANGTYVLTSKGIQAQRAMEGAANGQA